MALVARCVWARRTGYRANWFGSERIKIVCRLRDKHNLKGKLATFSRWHIDKKGITTFKSNLRLEAVRLKDLYNFG